MRLRIRQPAGKHERYAPGCFDGMIGMTGTVDLAGFPLGEATLLEAEVVEDGRAAWLTFDIPDRLPEKHR
jgi:hypothetical protein